MQALDASIPDPPALKLALVAGESSGDQIGAAVLASLFKRGLNLSVQGVGGPALASAGMRCEVSIDALSLRGYVEVIRHLPRLLRLRHRLIQDFRQWPADVFLGVDAPDFNLKLALELKRKAIRSIHLVGPSIWAWRPERKWAMARCVDHLLLLFPFESELYRETGLQTSFVGHPMADQIRFNPDRLAARLKLALQLSPELREAGPRPDGSRWFCLLPGSRSDEIHQHAALMLDAAQQLAIRYRHAIFLLPAASASIHAQLEAIIRSQVRVCAQRIFLVRGDARTCMAASDQVLAASGTVCLEAALIGRPMVIIYRMPELSYRWMRRLQLQPWIGLPNILAQSFVVPELIQSQANPAAMVRALELQWEDEAARGRLEGVFRAIHDSLRCDCASRAASIIESELYRR